MDELQKKKFPSAPVSSSCAAALFWIRRRGLTCRLGFDIMPTRLGCFVWYIIANKCMLVGVFFLLGGFSMVPADSRENAFLTGPILPPLIRFSLPLMLSLLLQGLYGAVDLAVVGRFASTASTAAVAVGSQMMVAVTAVITGLLYFR